MIGLTTRGTGAPVGLGVRGGGPVEVHAGGRAEVLQGDVLTVGRWVVTVMLGRAAVVLSGHIHRRFVAASHPPCGHVAPLAGYHWCCRCCCGC